MLSLFDYMSDGPSLLQHGFWALIAQLCCHEKRYFLLHGVTCVPA